MGGERFNIYKVTPDGAASWLCTRDAKSADAALEAASDSGLLRHGDICFVVDPNINPDHRQALFSVEAPVRLRARPASLGR